MTQSGEQITLKGVSGQNPENVFSFHRAMQVSYIIDVDQPEKVEIRTRYPNERQLYSFQMVFVMKGNLGFISRSDAKKTRHISAHQHNLCRIDRKSTRMVMSSAKDEVLCINLSHEFLSRCIPSSHPAYKLLMVKESKEAIMLAQDNMLISPETSAILQRLRNLSKSDITDQLLLESKTIELLALQLSQFEHAIPSRAAVQLKDEELIRMQQAREILINHTGQQLSLRALAHRVGTNEYNLKRSFKMAFGNTVYGYLIQYRMEQAKVMLMENDVTVAEISVKMGYKYATHFTSAFKKYFGYLPNKIKAGKLAMLIFIEDFSMIFENLGFLNLL